jgi:hypothetical protein
MTSEHAGATAEQPTGYAPPQSGRTFDGPSGPTFVAPPGPPLAGPPAADGKPAPRRRQALKVAGGAGLAAAAAVVAFAGVSALSSHSNTTNTSAPGPAGPGGRPGFGNNQNGGGPQSGPGGMPGGQGPGGGLGAALHGTFVVSDGNGGYVTEETQTGKVTALSATSITVLSSDGYSRSYTVTSNAVSGVATGHTVRVLATVSGQTATATRVDDETSRGTVTN